MRSAALSIGSPKRLPATAVILGLFAALIVLMIVSLSLGRFPVSLTSISRVLFTTPFGSAKGYSDTDWVVVEIIRLPRILEVALSGMGLGLAGAAMQGVFRNPLIGPEVCGVSAGSAFGGVLAIVLGWTAWGIVSMAFAFAFAALAVSFVLARLAGGASILALILAGIIVGSFFNASLEVLKYTADPLNKAPVIMFWLLGGFAGATFQKVGLISAVILVSGTAVLGLRWRINLLSLGEDDARSLGLNPQALRWILVALVASIVAAQVSTSGGIYFVGLIIPHFARMLVGPEHTKLLPASAMLGGIYLLGIDDITRSIATIEVPIGVLTSFIGAPIFAFLFWKQKDRGWSRG